MRGYTGGVNPKLLKMMRIVESYPKEITDRGSWTEEQIGLDHQLYPILTSLVDGDALDVVKVVDDGLGFERWRQYYKDNGEKNTGPYRTRLMQTLDPRFPAHIKTYQARIKKRKKIIKDYQTMSKDIFSESISMGVLQA